MAFLIDYLNMVLPFLLCLTRQNFEDPSLSCIRFSPIPPVALLFLCWLNTLIAEVLAAGNLGAVDGVVKVVGAAGSLMLIRGAQ